MIGRLNPAGLLAGRPEVQEQAMMAQQQPQSRQGLLGQTRGVIGGLLGGLRDRVEQGSPDMSWADRGMVLGAGLRQMGGVEGALTQQQQMLAMQAEQRQAQEAAEAQQAQFQEAVASVLPTLDPDLQAQLGSNPSPEVLQRVQQEQIRRGRPEQDPTSVREFQTAQQQGFPGSYMDFLDARRQPLASVNVNMPVPQREDILSIDGDYATIRDETSPTGVRRELIPGSASYERARMTEEEREQQDVQRFRNFWRTSGTALQDVNRTLEQVAENPALVGARGAILANVPESDQRVIRNRIQSINRNIGVEEIMAFREAGGTLGAIPVAQQQAFQELRGSLDQDLPFDEFMQNSMRLNNLYLDMIFPEGIPEGVDAPYYELPFDQYGRRRTFTQANPARPTTGIEMSVLPEGSFYIDPDDGQLYRKTGRRR